MSSTFGRAALLGAALSFSLFLFSCSPLTLERRLELADQVALAGDLHPFSLQNSRFSLKGYGRFPSHSESQGPTLNTIHIYIEGDGVAWESRYQPSRDPTPRDPTGLRLAAADSARFVIYLGRPCQYLLKQNKHCHILLWTHERYGKTVISTMVEAISQLKHTYGFKQIRLFGYSGGGPLAALIAAHRKDVISLTTFAANMDTAYWTELHGTEPLHGSLNPTDFRENLKHIPQVHYVGKKDDVVPNAVVESYQKTLGFPKTSKLISVPGMNHHGDWGAFWKRQQQRPLS